MYLAGLARRQGLRMGSSWPRGLAVTDAGDFVTRSRLIPGLALGLTDFYRPDLAGPVENLDVPLASIHRGI
jgi:hypothetical protein